MSSSSSSRGTLAPVPIERGHCRIPACMPLRWHGLSMKNGVCENGSTGACYRGKPWDVGVSWDIGGGPLCPCCHSYVSRFHRCIACDFTADAVSIASKIAGFCSFHPACRIRAASRSNQFLQLPPLVIKLIGGMLPKTPLAHTTLFVCVRFAPRQCILAVLQKTFFSLLWLFIIIISISIIIIIVITHE